MYTKNLFSFHNRGLFWKIISIWIRMSRSLNELKILKFFLNNHRRFQFHRTNTLWYSFIQERQQFLIHCWLLFLYNSEKNGSSSNNNMISHSRHLYTNTHNFSFLWWLEMHSIHIIYSHTVSRRRWNNFSYFCFSFFFGNIWLKILETCSRAREMCACLHIDFILFFLLFLLVLKHIYYYYFFSRAC